jgi:hypothetical protein
MASEFHRLQIEQAARGCISSQLSDWPALVAALVAERIVLPMNTSIETVTQICRLLDYYFISVDSAELVELTPEEKAAFDRVGGDFLDRLKKRRVRPTSKHVDGACAETGWNS